MNWDYPRLRRVAPRARTVGQGGDQCASVDVMPGVEQEGPVRGCNQREVRESHEATAPLRGTTCHEDLVRRRHFVTPTCTSGSHRGNRCRSSPSGADHRCAYDASPDVPSRPPPRRRIHRHFGQLLRLFVTVRILSVTYGEVMDHVFAADRRVGLPGTSSRPRRRAGTPNGCVHAAPPAPSRHLPHTAQPGSAA